ncbi:hypothetical protein IOK49_06095 [Fervidicoccus fontis]|uniref:SWIM-type domain-containing protein n=2 Tax=Fervidicoccus fontis TaxID=683846 RepID=I0A1J2_FERFK|nr:hypothetical protein [Fervidicoccus fontis]AFH42849.1 hypothetical protein FFONT_0861 [Fervidicoccus fontis Kam940]MBE9391634.1 hypothetical protein [Fervidicoccus fontis]
MSSSSIEKERIENAKKLCSEYSFGLPESSKGKALVKALEKKIVIISRNPLIAVFLGDKEDHILIPYSFCSCTDFSLNVIYREKRQNCYHLYSYCLAEKMGLITEKIINEPTVLFLIIKDIFENGKSKLLRK